MSIIIDSVNNLLQIIDSELRLLLLLLCHIGRSLPADLRNVIVNLNYHVLKLLKCEEIFVLEVNGVKEVF